MLENGMAVANFNKLAMVISFDLGKWQEVKRRKNKKGQMGSIEDYFPSQGGKDLKPENIFIDCEGHIKLVDFGLAKEMDGESSMEYNSLCGTPQYMAPEIMFNKTCGKASDWWSVGMNLYVMLTGIPPKELQDLEGNIFEDENNMELSYFSCEARFLIKELLQEDPSERLGSGVSGC
ncbi:hypothetical protein KI387_037824 [Taxus chinensis]|uniref:Protein kinase domain-containing protein n=1 Tax=Taxus chinensis TaxID=29808 RepID=A0AA38FW37_TAXCH|nr:hypothetical protein KI387_037824 [Taxus chinensis]